MTVARCEPVCDVRVDAMTPERADELASAPVTVALEGDEFGRIVLKLGLQGVWLRTADADPKLQLDDDVQVSICCDTQRVGPLEGVVRARGVQGADDYGLHEDEHLVHVAFDSMPVDHAREMLALIERYHRHLQPAPQPQQLPPTEEHVTDPDRVRKAIRALFADHVEGVVIVDGVRHPLVASRILPGDLAPLRWHSPNGALDGAEIVIESVGYNSLYSWAVTDAQWHGDEMATGVPAGVTRVRKRQFRRIGVEPGLRISFDHPVCLGVNIEREVIEISNTGLSFRSTPDEDLLHPGMVIGEAWVLDTESEIEVTLRVQRLGADVRGESFCGVAVEPRNRQDRDAWLELVNRNLNPNTRVGGTWSRRTWALFSESGYFRLSGKTPAHFSGLRRHFATLSRRLDANPEAGCQVVWPSERGIEASLSLTKVYTGTWLAHQLARMPGETPVNVDGPRVMRDIFLRGFEHAQQDPLLRWVIGYSEENVSWMRHVEHAFTRRAAGPEEGGVWPFRLMEWRGAIPMRRRATDLTIGPADPADVEGMVAHVRATRPKPYVEALDFTSDRFDMTSFSSRMSEAGIRRQRVVLAARKGDHLLAAAVLEVGEQGANLFRLVDSVRLFALEPAGVSAYGDLLIAAMGWFEARGSDAFVYINESDDQEHARDVGLTDLGRGKLWVLTAALVPDYLEHIYQFTVSRDVPKIP